MPSQPSFRGGSVADSQPKGDQPRATAESIAPRDASLSYRVTGVKSAAPRVSTRKSTRM